MSLSSIRSLLNDYSLSELNEKSSVEKMIWDKYGQSGAVFILDMSGFSRTTVAKGLVYYLAMVNRMQTIVEPILTRTGSLVKFDADNAFAFFSETSQAVEAAIEVNQVLKEDNSRNPEILDIQVSIGIDYGEFLYLHEVGDFFGNPVNFACKLGEDIGEAGEILVTETAWNQIGNNSYKAQVGAYQISGIAFKAYKLSY